MIATVVSPGSIPDFVHPPVPGESHDLYGDSHLDSIKLPALSLISSSSNNYISNNSALLSDPLLADNNSSTNSPNPQQISTPTIARESVREHASAAIVDAEQSSDAISWSKLVEACTLGHADVVQEIIAISPALKDSIDNVSSATGMNPLHFAAARGHSEVVRILVDQAGAGVDIQDREGEVWYRARTRTRMPAGEKKRFSPLTLSAMTKEHRHFVCFFFFFSQYPWISFLEGMIGF
jgi:hypothetical protein